MTQIVQEQDVKDRPPRLFNPFGIQKLGIWGSLPCGIQDGSEIDRRAKAGFGSCCLRTLRVSAPNLQHKANAGNTQDPA
ncbi:MAG: hypothetical protein AAFN27_01815 [Pseudomonadota bacterium]